MSDVLDQLYRVIASRKTNAPAESYTAKLFAAGEDEIVKKLGEEVIEVIVAAKGQGDERIVYEMADVIYHSMVCSRRVESNGAPSKKSWRGGSNCSIDKQPCRHPCKPVS